MPRVNASAWNAMPVIDSWFAVPVMMVSGAPAAGEALTVYGDGSQTRSFQFVEDLVEGVFRLLMSNFNEPVNIGTSEEMSILEFAKRVNELTGNSAGIVFKEADRIREELKTMGIELEDKRDGTTAWRVKR